MIFLKVNEANKVILTHYQPFHEKHGLGKTEEELRLEGTLLEELPARPEALPGKKLVLYINPIRWEYEDRLLTQEEKINKMVSDGILTQEQANDLLG